MEEEKKKQKASPYCVDAPHYPPEGNLFIHPLQG
jgi:hypothetical protein